MTVRSFPNLVSPKGIYAGAFIRCLVLILPMDNSWIWTARTRHRL